MKDDILNYVKEKIEEKRNANKRPLIVLLHNITNKFGICSKEYVKELIHEKKLFFGHLFNSFWISTVDKDNIFKI